MPRGSTSMSQGFIPAAGTRFQEEKGVRDSAELMAEDIQRKNGYQADPDIVRALSEASAGVVEWLADAHGVPFDLVEGFLYPGHRRTRMHATPRRTGEELMGSLLNAVESAGIDLLTEARVVDLHVDDGGRVLGVTLERPDGSRESIGCDALILACNGYGGNPELVERHLPALKDALYYGHEATRVTLCCGARAWGRASRTWGPARGTAHWRCRTRP
ncbi:FAD-dependent oxidoreductase [Halomonas sp. BC04]|uniref:FAD-dependent oxidoreductase n=1 Tax=Halomonas sp. BC04 TaxID=1403540 RepID=UPI0022B02B54|nr:FAD-binding protein [Halomonas sp. BC04]